MNKVGQCWIGVFSHSVGEKFPFRCLSKVPFPFQNPLIPEPKFPCGGSKFPLYRVKTSAMMEKILPFPQKKILSVWSSVPAVCARRHVLWHKFFRKNSPCCLLVRGKSLPLHPLSGREAVPARRRGAGGKKNEGAVKKKFGGFGRNPYLCSPFPPGEGGAPRDGGSLRRGRTKESVL